MTREIIKTDKAPAAVGPYSQGVVANGLLFTAMQIALDPLTGDMIGETAVEQAKQCLENIKAIIEAAGTSTDKTVKVMVFLTDISAFGEINKIYAEFFPDPPPARGVVEVSNLPKGALVAVEAIVGAAGFRPVGAAGMFGR